MTRPGAAATLTPRGTATRARIVEAAAGLIAARGVAGTSMDDVRLATATSKSQLYHYFDDKAALVRAVIRYQRDAVLAEQRLDQEPIDSIVALTRWRYRTVATHRTDGFSRGCRLGRLAAELVDADPQARAELAEAFAAWRQQLADGLAAMVGRGALRPDADPAHLAAGLLAALQGGLLLATAARSPEPLQAALDLAIEQIGGLVPLPAEAGADSGVVGSSARRSLVERSEQQASRTISPLPGTTTPDRG
jgi:TetR/AcrR family transcriptional repressor of nem operon